MKYILFVIVDLSEPEVKFFSLSLSFSFGLKVKSLSDIILDKIFF